MRSACIVECNSSVHIEIVFKCRMWTVPEPKDIARLNGIENEKMKLISENCGSGPVSTSVYGTIVTVHFFFQCSWTFSYINPCMNLFTRKK